MVARVVDFGAGAGGPVDGGRGGGGEVVDVADEEEGAESEDGGGEEEGGRVRLRRWGREVVGYSWGCSGVVGSWVRGGRGRDR